MDLSSGGAFCLALDLCFGAASRALRRTSRHLNLLHLPVNLQIVFVEPGKAQDHVLLAQRCDRKLGSLCMAFVAQDNVCNLGDSDCLIRGSVDVLDGDGGGETTAGDVV
jgi:acyl-coenzyme A thioesterase PaaI-like protein